MEDKNIATTAKCLLCSQIFTDPRMLRCLHSFCMKCLHKRFNSQGGTLRTSIKCPIVRCKKETPIPEGGIDAIQKDLRASFEAKVAHYQQKIESKSDAHCERCVELCAAASFCCECCELLCKDCTKDHKKVRSTHEHKLVEVGESKSLSSVLGSISSKPVRCPLHEDEPLKFYCYTCGTIICRDCADDEHKNHESKRLEKAAKSEKEELLVKLQEANSVKSKLETAMKGIKTSTRAVEAKKAAVDEEINYTFKVIQEALSARQAALLAKTSEIATAKKTALSIQHDMLKKVHTELSATTNKISDATRVYNPAEMLAAKGAMTFTLEDILKEFGTCPLQPCRNDAMPTFLNYSDLVKEITTFGEVTGGCYAAGSTADKHIPTTMVVATPRKIVVTARDLQGKPYPHGGERAQAELSLMGTNDPPVNCTVVDKKNGVYEVTFTPKVCGEHQLAITINNDHIKRSPYNIFIHKKKDYSTPQRCQRRFSCYSTTWDAAVDDNGLVYIAVYGDHCISVFNKKDGSSVRTIGTTPGQKGKRNGQFDSPTAVAVRGNVLYIADGGNNRVQTMTTSGEFISKFGSRGTGDGELNNPRGICLDPEGRIFVSESSNNRISVFTSDGKFSHHITKKLDYPWGLAFDPSGNLHVANYNDNTISVFNADGAFTEEYGSGVVRAPAGIAINDEGYSFIGEHYHGYNNRDRLLVLDSTHKPVTSIQAFNYAIGVALDKEGSVFVASRNDDNYYVAQYW